MATITGTTGSDVLVGTAADDVFYGQGGSDTFTGGGGHNQYVFDGDLGIAQITDFQSGVDQVVIEGLTYQSVIRISYGSQISPSDSTSHFVSYISLQGVPGGLTVWDAKLTSSDVAAPGSGTSSGAGAGVDLFGTSGADIIHRGGGSDLVFLWGEEGDDVLYADDGRSVLLGGAGNDTLYGGPGDDQLDGDFGGVLPITPGNDVLHGGAGNDQLLTEGGNDVLDGGPGADMVEFVIANPTRGEHIDLSIQGVAQDTGVGMMTLESIEGGEAGTPYDDVLTAAGVTADVGLELGAGGHDVLIGGSGNDSLTTHGGTNTLTGGAGSDFFQVIIAQTGSPFDASMTNFDTITDFQTGVDRLDVGGPAKRITLENHADGAVVWIDIDGDGVDDTKVVLTSGQINASDMPLFGVTVIQLSTPGDDVIAMQIDNLTYGGASIASYAQATSGVHVSLALGGLPQDTVGAGIDTLTRLSGLIGSAYGDILEGGGWMSTTLTGGLGADVFVYSPGDANVTVTDFSAAQGDTIDLRNLGTFSDLNDVLAQSSQAGPDSVITIGSGSLRLQGVSTTSLTASDFVFPTPTVGPGVGGTPGTGDGTLTGTSGSDWLQGRSSNDTLHGGAGSDYLDGGAGLNTAIYDGVSRQYAVAAGGATVSGGPEGGTDDLVNIQRIQFVDGYLATSPNDLAGQVYRLYEGTLNRGPDPEGLAAWVHQLNVGTSLQTVVDGFVGSPEFQAHYGSLSNSDFVTLLYNNVLDRNPDQAGLDAWVGLLNSGQDTRAQVVLGFSQSPEDISNSAAAVQQGLWVGNVAAAEVARLYDTTLGRLPDLLGLTGWTRALENGASLQTVVNGFTGSPEFLADYGNLNNNDFVTQLYANTLRRPPDPIGLTAWVGLLNSGQDTRAQVVLGFSDSPEHIADTAPHIDGGIWLAA